MHRVERGIFKIVVSRQCRQISKGSVGLDRRSKDRDALLAIEAFRDDRIDGVNWISELNLLVSFVAAGVRRRLLLWNSRCVLLSTSGHEQRYGRHYRH